MLARETPLLEIRASFEEAGFSWIGEMTDAEAIGLKGPAGVRVAPERLLASYVDLVRTPWAAREDARREILSGLRDAAGDGTAAGLRLWGFMAKTGTVPALDEARLKTSGFAMVLDDAGFAFLGLLRRGTGREAAIRAGAEISKLRPGTVPRTPAATTPQAKPRPVVKARGLEDPVRVEMLDELRLTEVRLKNLGSSPVDSSRGYVGPGAVVEAAPGDRFSEGDWEIRAAKPVFERRVHASLEVGRREGPLGLIATMTARNYANGILKAELGTSTGPRRVELASAVLRYAARGPRHAEADVCDSTHCAWFVGEGPVPRWLRPDTARNETEMAKDLTDEEWSRAVGEARAEPRGPELWTADCGGDPVSPHFIWGGGDRRVVGCPRHPKGSGRAWRREWPEADLIAVFGSRAQAIDVTTIHGQWMLKVKLTPRSGTGSPTTIALTYDEAHRRLAQRLGWDAMPAPAARVSRTGGGFVAEGVGFGHRAGLCLGSPAASRQDPKRSDAGPLARPRDERYFVLWRTAPRAAGKEIIPCNSASSDFRSRASPRSFRPSPRPISIPRPPLKLARIWASRRCPTNVSIVARLSSPRRARCARPSSSSTWPV
jgi:hypothetical protein